MVSGDFGYSAEKYSAENDWWHGWFDGAAQPNPGRIGLGGTLRAPSGEQRDLSLLAGTGCNNEAELLALLAVLDQAIAAGARRVRVYGDSDFAIRAGLACLVAKSATGAGAESTGSFAITQVPRLLSLIARLAEMLRRFKAVELVWIPRHRNGDADRLSRQALGLPHKPAPVPGKKSSGKRSRCRR